MVVAALMRHHSATLEDALWYLGSSRPGATPSHAVISMLAGLEEDMFGRQITDVDSLWYLEE